jgi:hypothetical protein
MLSETYTTTSLGVDDLVQHCCNVGYATADHSDGPNIDTSGSLTMAVQPSSTNTATAPSEDQIEYAMEVVLSNRPTGETALADVATAVHNTGSVYPYNDLFDPTSDFDISFNPNSTEDGGAWDAFDLNMSSNITDGIDWDSVLAAQDS